MNQTYDWELGRMSDAELIEQFRQGDVVAFNRLVHRWERPLYNFILRYAGSREEAKDLCQLAFIRAYHHLKRLRDPQKFSPWIYQIVLNVCRDEQRKQQRRQTFSLNHEHDNEANTTQSDLTMEKHPRTDPELAAQHRDMRELLNRALQQLPEEQRVVIIMKSYQGLKFSEIAETLDISVNTAKSRMYYGLIALKGIFDRWDIDKEKISYEV